MRLNFRVMGYCIGSKTWLLSLIGWNFIYQQHPSIKQKITQIPRQVNKVQEPKYRKFSLRCFIYYMAFSANNSLTKPSITTLWSAFSSLCQFCFIDKHVFLCKQVQCGMKTSPVLTNHALIRDRRQENNNLKQQMASYHPNAPLFVRVQQIFPRWILWLYRQQGTCNTYD